MGIIYHEDEPNRYRDTLAEKPRNKWIKGAVISSMVVLTIFLLVSGGLYYQEEIRNFAFNRFGLILPMGNLGSELPEIVGEDEIDRPAGKEKLYSWVGEDGVTNFSNVGAPEGSDVAVAEGIKLWPGKTRIVIDNNVIYVPVEVRQGDKTINTRLILDTGSNKTALFTDFADQLGAKPTRVAKMKLADGKSVKARIGRVSRLRVGSKHIGNKEVMIISRVTSYQDVSGLLGQDFLGKFTYKIDPVANVIIWD